MKTSGWKTSGQMAVELAIMVPVALVVALTVYNLARFSEACAAFDRIAADAVVSQGISPSGDAGAPAVGAIETTILNALNMKSCTVKVSAQRISSADTAGNGIGFPLSPLLTRFTCTLSYRPWPGSFVVAGVAYDAPVLLSHTRELVVDRYRGGVVM